MNTWQLWLFILIIGVVLVIIYTLVVKALVKDPNTTPWLSDTAWLFLHFIVGLILGIFLPNPTIQMLAFITIWEVLEKILGIPFPQYFAESNEKAIADIFVTTGGYALGQWLRSRLTKQPWRFGCL